MNMCLLGCRRCSFYFPAKHAQRTKIPVRKWLALIVLLQGDMRIFLVVLSCIKLSHILGVFDSGFVFWEILSNPFTYWIFAIDFGWLLEQVHSAKG